MWKKIVYKSSKPTCLYKLLLISLKIVQKCISIKRIQSRANKYLTNRFLKNAFIFSTSEISFYFYMQQLDEISRRDSQLLIETVREIQQVEGTLEYTERQQQTIRDSQKYAATP